MHRDCDEILNSSCLLITSFPSGSDKDVNAKLHRLELIFRKAVDVCWLEADCCLSTAGELNA